jgi:hypothetical protein
MMTDTAGPTRTSPSGGPCSYPAVAFAALVFGPLSGPLRAAEGSNLGVRSTRCLAARRAQYVGSQAATLPIALVYVRGATTDDVWRSR